jgi:hypothetical protein
MIFDDAVADGKPESGSLSLGFCGKKRFADPIQQICLDASAIVVKYRPDIVSAMEDYCFTLYV